MSQSGGSGVYVYASVLAVNLISFSCGGAWSWSSPVLPKLTSLDPTVNPLPRPVTTLEESWIAAAMNLGAIVGSLSAGPFSGKFGKKNTILLFSLPVIIGHILCAVAFHVLFFIIARLLIGASTGMVFAVVPGYVADIAQVRDRGKLGSVLGVCNCLGVLFMYLIGPFLSVRVFSLVNLAAPVGFCVLFFFLGPESPYDLVKRGKKSQAEATLIKLRAGTKLAAIQKELVNIQEGIQIAAKQSQSFRVLLQGKAIKKGLVISNGVMAFQQFSGICAIISYTQTIFQTTGTSIPPTYSAMIVGTVQLLSNIASAQLIEKLGRRLLLILSHVFCILFLVALGAYFLVPTPGLDWLPIASLILFVVSYNMGLANIPWVLMAELFPAEAKAVTSTITSFSGFGLSFLITLCFPGVSRALGMTGTFWGFAGILAVGLVWCVIVLPETKGKSIQEIQTLLESNKK